METKEKESIKVLNDLVVINNDRIEGYEKAAKETEDVELKGIFSAMSTESRKFKSELLTELVEIGGEAAEGTSTSGKVYRAWMDIKAALTGKNRKAILASCETGEDVALEAYRDALKSDDLSADCREIVTKQEASLKRSHDKIKSLRDKA